MENEKMNNKYNIDPAATAIKRKNRITPYAKGMVEMHNKVIDFESVLDFGCGWSKDVELYRENGIEAVGYDRHPKFGCTSKPDSKFDLVTMIFVLNVLPSREERLEAISQAKQYLKNKGALLIVSRTDRVIEKKARESGWESYNDGYISRVLKNNRAMFQKGLSKDDIIDLAEESGLALHPKDEVIKFKPYSSYALFIKDR